MNRQTHTRKSQTTGRKAVTKRTSRPKEEPLVITRVFEAPRELVWRAWTEPEYVKRWWGPKMFSCPVAVIDLRVGGKYLNCMRSNQGQNFWSTGIYQEIVPLKRIICTDNFADAHGNVVPASYYGLPGESPERMLVTVTFEDMKGRTKMTLKHAGMPGNMAKDASVGWNESFDKLVANLKQW
jgi:uncharacterized protein YndB with AHSA1/START domain